VGHSLNHNISVVPPPLLSGLGTSIGSVRHPYPTPKTYPQA